MRDIRTTVMGNVTGEVKETVHPDGNITVRFRIGVTSRFFNNEQGGYADRKTEFINVYARRSLGQNVLASISKGEPLIVTGRLSTQEWVDDKGTQRFALSITADAIGHDMSFGTSSFSKASRAGEIPPIDTVTGEVLGADAEDDDSLTAPRAETTEQMAAVA